MLEVSRVELAARARGAWSGTTGRTAVSLLSAGWVWHPLSTTEIYDLSQALGQPQVLDAAAGEDAWTRATGVTEISGACFAGQDIVVSTSADVPDTDEPGRLGPCMLARWSMAYQEFTWTRQLAQTAGDLLAFGRSILALYQCPRRARADDECECYVASDIDRH